MAGTKSEINVVGIDGCRGGWCAIGYNAKQWQGEVYTHIASIVDAYPKASVYLIDIPIGLGNSEISRSLEQKLRALLKPGRSSSVFNPPVREALSAKDYNSASQINYEITGKKLSKQTWNIMDKIQEVDSFLQDRPNYINRFYEAHPELCFAGLNGGKPMLNSKSGQRGYEERLNLLKRHEEFNQDIIGQLMNNYQRSVLKSDDVLDACCLSLSAFLGCKSGFQICEDNSRKDFRGIGMKLTFFLS